MTDLYIYYIGSWDSSVNYGLQHGALIGNTLYFNILHTRVLFYFYTLSNNLIILSNPDP